jgi:hypothetical protein
MYAIILCDSSESYCTGSLRDDVRHARNNQLTPSADQLRDPARKIFAGVGYIATDGRGGPKTHPNWVRSFKFNDGPNQSGKPRKRGILLNPPGSGFLGRAGDL